MTADAHALTAPEHAQAEAHHTGGIGNPVLGMLLFITSEVMFFAGLFAAYFSIRANFVDTDGVHRWPPLEFEGILDPFRLTTESGDLNLILPATLILVLSSFTCQWACGPSGGTITGASSASSPSRWSWASCSS